ncbi:hypothetical protein [Streptomyces nitrosporeus]|uniref:hypothetical protein n=1 Tax=Streptomyces nitrosporeus TaxID=28894 RepID=UPI00167F0263|nr:hypothetical protein [Streptomyces nitrosporeus]
MTTQPLGLNELLAAAPVPPGTEPFPAQLTVFCDECGETATHDYVVHTGMTRDDRLDVARQHLTGTEEWDCGTAGDYCPDCKSDEPGMCPACDTAATERCTICGSCRCDQHDECAAVAASIKAAAEHKAKLDAAKTAGQQRADEFNRLHPVGTRVVAYPGIRPEDPAWHGDTDLCKRLATVTRTPAWILGHGEPVVSVEGHAGGISLDHVDVTGERTS